MLKEVVFSLAPGVAKVQTVKGLLEALDQAGIGYAFSTGLSSSPAPEDCLVLTDSDAGISSSRAAGVPCIGYAPPEGYEDMSGAYALFEDFASIDVAYLCRTHAHAVGYPAYILSTKRLIVREFCKEDFPALYVMCAEPATASMMEESLSDYETELEKHYAYIRNVYPLFDLALWGVFEKNSGCLIGRMGFSLPEDSSDTFRLGYLIDVPYRGKGYAKECIPALLAYASEQGYTEVSARIKKDNIISAKVLEQCRFPYERKCDAAEGIVTYFIHLKE